MELGQQLRQAIDLAADNVVPANVRLPSFLSQVLALKPVYCLHSPWQIERSIKSAPSHALD
jgi:hypothetical protein